MSKVLEDKIEAIEMWCLRRIGNVKWSDKISNESVLQMLKTKRQLLTSIQKRKSKYFVHIKRRKNILTTALEGKLEGKRPRGRSRNTWMSHIKEWTGQTAYACTQQATARALHGKCHGSSTVEEAMTPPGKPGKMGARFIFGIQLSTKPVTWFIFLKISAVPEGR